MAGLNDLYLELLRAGILALLTAFLFFRARQTRCATLPGARLIFAGFALLLLATLLDVTDEIPGLERFVVIGATGTEAYIETFFAYLPAFFLLFLGFIKIVPALDSVLETETRLHESEEKFRKVFETIPDVIGITRLRDGMVVDLSQSIEGLAKIPREQLIGRSSLEMGVWANPADRERMVQGVLANGHIYNLEALINTGDGRQRDCLVSASLMHLQGEQHILSVFKDITERKEVQWALQQSEIRFRLIFEYGPDPMVIARADGSGILDVNQAFVRETGITREEALGKTSSQLKIWADPAQRDKFMEQLRRDGAVINLEAQLCRKNGEIRTCLVSAQLINLSGIPCMLLSNRDITTEKQAEIALLETDRMKSEFISTAAHELRTPLTTILGYSELLLNPDNFKISDEKRRVFLGEIFSKSEQLGNIIEDMLDISRIESGRPLALDLQPHTPADWLQGVLRPFETLGGNHPLQLDLHGRQPEKLTFDLPRLSQVVENLLSNAAKYSPPGRTITITGETVGDEYVVRVADQGIGMTAEQAAHVFDKFWRADASNTAIGGLGLGMSIARQIVELHGGRIWIESELGKGTTVSFSLPLQPKPVN